MGAKEERWKHTQVIPQGQESSTQYPDEAHSVADDSVVLWYELEHEEYLYFFNLLLSPCIYFILPSFLFFALKILQNSKQMK